MNPALKVLGCRTVPFFCGFFCLSQAPRAERNFSIICGFCGYDSSQSFHAFWLCLHALHNWRPWAENVFLIDWNQKRNKKTVGWLLSLYALNCQQRLYFCHCHHRELNWIKYQNALYSACGGRRRDGTTAVTWFLLSSHLTKVLAFTFFHLVHDCLVCRGLSCITYIRWLWLSWLTDMKPIKKKLNPFSTQGLQLV